MLSVDRAKKEHFSRNGEDIGEALSHLLAYAISTSSDFVPSAGSNRAIEGADDAGTEP